MHAQPDLERAKLDFKGQASFISKNSFVKILLGGFTTPSRTPFPSSTIHGMFGTQCDMHAQLHVPHGCRPQKLT